MQINLVVFIYTFVSLSVCVSSNKYCEICANHTMCKFTKEILSASCENHDEYNLSENDIRNLVAKINEKRNFIANGLAKKGVLPQAANMRKVRWSDELATFAQRWANQCHPAVNPDRKDQCRDLSDHRANQLVTSILGWTPGLQISSFVNIWFMNSMQFHGSVSYYNRSINQRTNDLTQLIWADSYLVGCGFISFTLPESKIHVKRLVCNFAPEGNVHGKPVYTIGYPATQCSKDQIQDTEFTGLCTGGTQVHGENKSLSDGILRILDSSVNGMDPVDVNIRQEPITKQARNQIIRHIHNKTNDNYFENFRGMPHMTLNPNLWFQVTTGTGKYMVYHGGQEHAHSPRFNKYRKNYVLSTERLHYNPQAEEEACTRGNANHKTRSPNIKDMPIDECKMECSKKLQQCNGNKCLPSNMFSLHPFQPETKMTQCGCDGHSVTQHPHSPKTTRMIPTSCGCRVTCEVSTTHQCPTIVQCPTLYHTINVTPPNFHYYNLALRSADSTTHSKSRNAPKKRFGEDSDYPENEDYVTDSSIKFLNKTYLFEDSKDTGYMEFQLDNDKIKRTAEDVHSAFPLWDSETYSDKNLRQVKALRYTTLPGSYHINKKIIRVTSKAITDSFSTVQYSITNVFASSKDKYLSFEELMELRKNQAHFFQNGEWRRDNAEPHNELRKGTTKKKSVKKTTKKHSKTKAAAKKTTAKKTTKKTTAKKTAKKTTATKTTKKTTATKAAAHTESHTIGFKSNDVKEKLNSEAPVIQRIDHCTRILTCTWTALTNSDGNLVTPGGGGGGPSRTPIGYVDGCTRTSTCTRIHVDRNILKTTAEFEDPNIARLEDPDYCDRRKRDDDDLVIRPNETDHNRRATSVTHHYDSYIDTYTEEMPTTPSSKINESIVSKKQSIHRRRKRQSNALRESIAVKKTTEKGFKLSYYNLHNLVLHRTLGVLGRNIEEHYKNCSCNSSYTIRPEVETILIICYVYIYFEYLY